MIKATIFTLLSLGTCISGKAQSSIISLEKISNYSGQSSSPKHIDLSPNTITDIDGNTYPIIQIGNQVWMKENLRVTKFQNGDIIPNITDNKQWQSFDSPALCSYKNNFEQSIELRLGLLYNGFVVQDKREVCPEGWTIPSDSDFYQLIKTTGGPFAAINLKSENSENSLWKQYFYASSSKNELGFTILPAGSRKNEFEGLHENAIFFTRRLATINGFYAFSTNYASDSFNRIIVSKYQGLSIRCIKE